MTKEEAIKILKFESGYFCDFKGCQEQQAYSMAIKALEQEPCEDCISRKAVIDAIDTYDKFGYTETGCFVREPKGDYVPYIHFDDVIKCIKNASSVTPKPKTDVLDKIRAEIEEWYWQADKQALAKDPCVVDAMVDLFIRMIKKYESEDLRKKDAK